MLERMKLSSHRNRTIMIIGLSFLVTACQGLIPGAERDPPQLYELTPKGSFEKGLPRTATQLVVETPVASAGLTTSRIAIKTSPTKLDYYEKSEWTDTAPRLVQTLLIESFENSKRIVAVGREGAGLRSDYILKVDLREFQAEIYKGKKPRVHVNLKLKLVRMPDRVIIAAKAFDKCRFAASDSLGDAIKAYDQTLGAAMKRAVGWTLRAMKKDRPNRNSWRYLRDRNKRLMPPVEKPGTKKSSCGN